MNSGCYEVALYLTNCVTSNIRTTFSGVSITLESFYSSFVAGIHLPHQGVVDSYDLYNGNPHKGEKIYIYIEGSDHCDIRCIAPENALRCAKSTWIQAMAWCLRHQAIP